ncbi:hypothetical protein PB2503_03147 [Parvularcula bermudensis HTCC2503]|uniref:Fe-S metabolism associated domain-containing protein n=1 Tax=Parvularcula bermudensis (strain ATCC BAA-594 / HTCC2503 / KCTC 12087) TaxID=314260 RepID=E0TD47_PARBH|nr:SufE family protein [Parvularcula bermudensis]ADM08706.1 hypothetical protein PB2503_03147 [Parvularcula bermudensis HTCC2503]
MSDLPDFEAIKDDMAFLEDWDERYRYIIDLGRQLPPLAEEERSEDTRVRGCASQVWLVFDTGEAGHLRIRGDSDAAIVKGLIAILLSLYKGKSAADIAAIDPKAALGELDLEAHITSQRSNGLASMIARIRTVASAG